jgi:hypothetical protein
LQGWQTMAIGLKNVADMVVQGIFPWCFTPELYAARPDYIESLAAFVRKERVYPPRYRPPFCFLAVSLRYFG